CPPTRADCNTNGSPPTKNQMAKKSRTDEGALCRNQPTSETRWRSIQAKQGAIPHQTAQNLGTNRKSGNLGTLVSEGAVADDKSSYRGPSEVSVPGAMVGSI